MATASEVIRKQRSLEVKRRKLQDEEAELRSRSEEGTLSSRGERQLSHVTAQLLKLAADEEAAREELREVARAEGFTVTNGPIYGGEPVSRKGSPQFLRRVDPTDEFEEMCDRGRSALDGLVRDGDLDPADAERTEGLIQGPEESGKVDAELIVRGSNPSYRSAWRKYMTGDPGTWQFGLTRDEQDAFAATQQFSERTGLTTTTGAVLVPTHLDPTIRLTNTGAINAMRHLATVETLSVGSIYHAVTSTGASAEWLTTSQLSEVTDATPSLTGVSITPQSADVYITASWEFRNDAPALEQQLGRVFQDAKDRLESDAFTGTSSSKVASFTGSVTALGASSSTVSATTNASFGAVDVYKTFRALPARYQPGAQWLANYQWEADIRQFATGTGPQHAFWADLSQGQPAQLLGRPWNGCTGMVSSLSAATASTDYVIALADWRQLYMIVDGQGSFVGRNDWVVGANQRPTASTGWLFWWRTAGGVLNIDAGRVLVC